MSKKVICPFFTLLECLNNRWNDEGASIYYLYENEPAFMMTASIKTELDFHTKKLELYKHEIIKFGFTFNEMLKIIYQHSIPIYYSEMPIQFALESTEQVNYEQFANDAYYFYSNGGKYKPDGQNIKRLFYGEEILDVIKENNIELFSKNFKLASRSKKINECYLNLLKYQKEIYEKYGRHYAHLTRDEFYDYFTSHKKLQNFSKQYIDILWMIVTHRDD